MAIEPQRGSSGILLMGIQVARGGETAYATPVNTWGGFIPRRFIYTRNTLAVTGAQINSESIIGGASASAPILDRTGGGGDLEFEFLPEDLPHILRWILNPKTAPASVAVPSQKLVSTAVAEPNGGFTHTQFATATQDAGVPALGINTDGDGYAQAQWPGKIVADVTGTLQGSMRVQGFRRLGRTSRRVQPVDITVPAPSTGSRFETTQFPFRVVNISFPGKAAGSTYTIDWEPNAYDTAISLNSDGNISDGVTFAGRKSANNPFVAPGSISNSAEIEIGNTIRVRTSVLCSDFLGETLPTNLNARAVELPSPIPGITPATLAPEQAFPRSDTQEFMGSSLAFVQLVGPSGPINITNDTGMLIARSVRLRINNNLEDAEGFNGDPFTTQKPSVGGDGVTQITLEVDFTAEGRTELTDNITNFDQLYKDTQALQLKFGCFRFLANGRGYMITFTVPAAYLNEPSTEPVESGGTLVRRFSANLVPSTGGTADEVSISIRHATEYSTTVRPS